MLLTRRRFILLSFLYATLVVLPEVRVALWISGPLHSLKWPHELATRASNLSHSVRWTLDTVNKRSLATPTYLVSPLSQRLLEVGGQLDPSKEIQYEFVEPGGEHDSQCLTLQSNFLLTREEIDESSGLPVRKCRGPVQLNRCEGACSSSLEPSAVSQFHMRRNCFCCTEGSFRRIQVRLGECYSITSLGINERLLAPPLDPIELSYMDLELDEPIQCKCRRCKPFV